MPSLKIVTGTRLHFGLIDLSGARRTIDGGYGLYLHHPAILVKASPANSISVKAPNGLRRRCLRLAGHIAGEQGLPGVAIRVETCAMPHCGLGTGTQVALAVVQAVQGLMSEQLDVKDAARLAGRGGTSGIGVWGYQEGGLIIDGGRRFGRDKPGFGPSRCFSSVAPPERVARVDFPDWPILLVRRREFVPRICGTREARLFRELTPIPLREVGEICRLLLLELLPAVLRASFDDFVECMEELRELGFKRREIDVAGCRGVIRILEQHGVRGAGQSSWGPTIFGFAENYDDALALKRQIEGERRELSVILTHARNYGATITRSESDSEHSTITLPLTV